LQAKLEKFLMRVINFIKNWTLLCSLIAGTVVYLLFSEIPFLEPTGDFAGPILIELMPFIISTMLYITFCKMQIHDLRPRTWHFVLQGIRAALSGLTVIAIQFVKEPEIKLMLEGVFICVICPTAAAAPVITEKLGGNIASLTIFLLIANVVTSIIIPLFFPLVEKGADISFIGAFFMVLKRVIMVLVVPLILALLTRKFLPQLSNWLNHYKNIAFYLWTINLAIVMGLTARNIIHAPISGWTLVVLLIIPLVLAILQFSIGKAVGKHYGDSIGAGQALGQKNTVVGIWLTIKFLNPYASLAPCAYVIWQNIINAVQIWYKQKHGYLKW
jgi:BASS family bile acid:Na+ symporter